MEEEKTEEKKIKRKKISKAVAKVNDINSSFDVLEDLINNLLRMLSVRGISKAAYEKVAQVKMDTRTYKSAEEKAFWNLRQINYFKGTAFRSALISVRDEFSKKKEKSKNILETIPIIESIQKQFKNLKKYSESAFSTRDREFNSTQEILDEKERLLEAQQALGVKGSLKDDKTAKKMKDLGSMREEAKQSNILAIETVEAIIEALEELEGASGLMNLARSYYRRYSQWLRLAGFALGGISFFIFAVLVYKKLYPLFVTESKQLVKSEEKSELQKAWEDLISGTDKKRELTPDELFEMALLKKDRFIPNCKNSYVFLAGKSLSENISDKEAKDFLLSKNISIEGDNPIQIIKVRNENELEVALKNGGLNSPYCVKGKLILPKELGYDLGRFPVFLSHEFDPTTQLGRMIIKEQLDFAKRKMRRNMVSFTPKLFLGKKEEGTVKSEEYREAMQEYLKNYRKAILVAEGKSVGS